MSYADVAASGLEDAPKEVRVAADKAIQHAEEAIQKDIEKAEELKKELDKEGKTLYSQLIELFNKSSTKVSSVVSEYSACALNRGQRAANITITELQNPVVATQVVVGLTGAVAAYLAYLERGRILSNKYVVGIHAGVITALVLADGYLFGKYYKQYKK